MCADLPVVNAAIESGEDVQTTACHSSSGRRCTHFESCPKQANRAEVAEADVVIAAYDALFTGTTMPPESIGLILIDEGFWQRASDTLDGLSVESFAHERYGARKLLGTQGGADTEAELQALWTSAVEAFDAGGEGRFRGGICLRPV
ncbi:MAG: hypothetical protein H0T41_14160 [Rhodobacteraceae bacterium]|nr:hypothetical protein [Paracoccaceae bacterium]